MTRGLRARRPHPAFPDSMRNTQALFDFADAIYPMLDNMTHHFLVRLRRPAYLLDLIRSVEPTKFKAAHYFMVQLKQLSRVRDTGGIVRLGRVRKAHGCVPASR